MKIEIIDYQPAHVLEIMEKHPRPREMYWAKYSDWAKWAFIWKERGPSYTLLIEDEIIMSAGVMIHNPHLGEAWMVLSSLFYQYPKECFRVVRDKLNQIIDDHGLKRVQAITLTNFPEAEHWLTHLGFENETPTPRGLRRFGPGGEDMFMYAREA